MDIVLIRGVGDVGSLVAVTLARGGFRVLLHDRPRPSYYRRAISFTDALFDGAATFDGVTARRIDDIAQLGVSIGLAGEIPVSDAELGAVLAEVRPQVLVDARMRKHADPEPQRDLASRTIGLGPGFIAGVHVDVVIETAYEAMRKVIHAGRALDLAGEPRPLGGHGRERFVYAPVAGIFRTALVIGGKVDRGQLVGLVGETCVRAPFGGWLRGLAHDACEVERGAKIVEVDASATPASVGIVGERPRRIAEGVLAAVREWRAVSA